MASDDRPGSGSDYTYRSVFFAGKLLSRDPAYLVPSVVQLSMIPYLFGHSWHECATCFQGFLHFAGVCGARSLKQMTKKDVDSPAGLNVWSKMERKQMRRQMNTKMVLGPLQNLSNQTRWDIRTLTRILKAAINRCHDMEWVRGATKHWMHPSFFLAFFHPDGSRSQHRVVSHRWLTGKEVSTPVGQVFVRVKPTLPTSSYSMYGGADSASKQRCAFFTVA